MTGAEARQTIEKGMYVGDTTTGLEGRVDKVTDYDALVKWNNRTKSYLRFAVDSEWFGVWPTGQEGFGRERPGEDNG